MVRGKLIVVEGTDCSGKETQTTKLVQRLESEGVKVVRFYFPHYESPTGKIVGGPFLGKSHIAEGWFPEGAPNVDPKVASMYYAADRAYHLPKINSWLNEGKHVVLDRYTYSSMAHQGCKLKTAKERQEMFSWLEKLEFDLLGLPKPDVKVFLHMPYEYGLILRTNRTECLDQNERNEEHLIQAESTYMELSQLYQFHTITCVRNREIRTIEDIHDELYEYVMNCFNQ